MLRAPIENQFLQAKFRSFLAEPAQKFFSYMSERSSSKFFKQCIEMGEKTILPFVDEVITAVCHRVQQQSERREDRWLTSKKDFKRCKGILHGLFKSKSSPPSSKTSSALLLTMFMGLNSSSTKITELDKKRTKNHQKKFPLGSHSIVKRSRAKTEDDVHPVVKFLVKSFSVKKGCQAQKFRIARVKSVTECHFEAGGAKRTGGQPSQRRTSVVERVMLGALVLNDFETLINKRKGTDSVRTRAYTF